MISNDLANCNAPQTAALVAERNSTASRIIALESLAFAALMARKRPEQIERLQNEVLSLRARVRALDAAIMKHVVTAPQ